MKNRDPIGIADEPAARDEYDSYLDPIGGQLRQGAEGDDLARYLSFVETKLMGFATSPEKLRPAAQAVVDWYQGAAP
jgi:hypothetical protein